MSPMNYRTTLALLVLFGATTCCVGQTTVDIDLQIVTDNALVNLIVNPINPLLKTVFNLLNDTINALLPNQSALATRLQTILAAIEDAVLNTSGNIRDRLQRLKIAVQTAITEIGAILTAGGLDPELVLALDGILAALQILLIAIGTALVALGLLGGFLLGK